MKTIASRREPKLGLTFSASFFLHLLFIVVVARFSSLLGPMDISTVVYQVDLMNLPVESPQEGNPSVAAGADADPGPDTPLKPAAPKSSSSSDQTLPASSDSTRQAEEFNRRLEGLQQKAEARHAAEAMEKIRQKIGSSKAGATGGTGTDVGSDYTSFLHTRLIEAFATTITFQSKNPEAAVRLLIDGKGRIISTRMEKSSGDKLFDDSVLRAIGKAARLLPAPPGGAFYEHGFVFRPQGISK